MDFFARTFARGFAAVAGTAVGGPALGYAAWKGTGFALSGNPLHLIPGGTALAEGSDAMDAGISLGGLDPTGSDGGGSGGKSPLGW